MGDDGDSSAPQKSHKARHSGVKADKKKAKNVKPTDRPKNAKAFAIQSARKAEKQFRRKEDLITKKTHIPLVDKTPEEPPPIIIAVVGPAKVGKTTLINNLIKNFTRTNVTSINGPVTIVTSKKRRITLIECNNDINSMIDIAKCADLVLLLCDASFGFEMEIFEFLNICQVHGMPKVMGILTHLDMIKNAKTLKKQKKMLKHRFWTEVYQGAKLFYLSGIIHGEYLRHEVKNLARFISVMKFRPLTWRSGHSYVLADRMEDITNAENIRLNPKCDRDVVLYGYMRGVPLRKENMVHIAGYGDTKIDELSVLPDPCPLPSGEKKRTLMENERVVYAPMSGVGGIVYDKDSVYIELQGSHSHTAERDPEIEELMNVLEEQKTTVEDLAGEQEFKFFSESAAIKSAEFVEEAENGEKSSDEDQNDSEDDSGMDSEVSDDEDVQPGKRGKLGWHGDDAESDPEPTKDDEESSDEEYQTISSSKFDTGNNSEANSDEEDENEAFKKDMDAKARLEFFERQAGSRDLMRIVYGKFSQYAKESKKLLENEEEEELGGLFRSVRDRHSEISKQKALQNKEESCFYQGIEVPVRDWTTEDNKKLVKDLFVTGTWKDSEDASELLKLDDMSDGESETYGDFEDLETGEKFEAKRKMSKTEDSEAENDETEEKPKGKKLKLSRIEESNMSRNEIMERKRQLKAKFDAEYDNPEKNDDHWVTGDHKFYEELKARATKQSELNREEFKTLEEEIRLQVEGYRAGLYVRMLFKNMPCEFVKHFNPAYPILIGGLNIGEENVGFVQSKVKKHRWYKKTLKTQDPLILSIGWRRFQTLPIFAKVEDDMKQRYLKYTPNHVTCSMSFYGPVTPQNTGVLAVQTVSNDVQDMKHIGFRIAATGAVNLNEKSTQIMKKLKLVGTPFKIYKKSAFIKDMFTSTLEVAKFEGAKIKTVSGIRGQIKKAVNEPEGAFRATFEDKILLSDIVFCRTWYQIEVPKFYTTVNNLLLPEDKKSQWHGMKTLGQLKREKGIRNQVNPDSLYTEIKREEKAFRPLVIPKSLQKALPYKDKPKKGPVNPKKSFDSGRIAVVRAPHEQKIANMMKMIKTNFQFKEEKRKMLSKKKLEKFRKEKEREEFDKFKRQKELRKKVFKTISKMDTTLKSTKGNR
ncbi:ribosome biogenesis protein BMS1 homolog [Culicoides brevitarsis]|uniref:ribosome biogenesis protein BMS1 homolog n=1 Tax=Culicoides brevitarsis TaxID=469753 RepID=UPI00307BB2C4